MPTKQGDVGVELSAVTERRLTEQRWIVDGMKVASTFVIGAAAAVGASAWQAGGGTALNILAAALLGVAMAALIFLFFGTRVESTDLDGTLAEARVQRLSDEELILLLHQSSLEAVRRNERTVGWLVPLNLAVIVVGTVSGALSAIEMLS